MSNVKMLVNRTEWSKNPKLMKLIVLAILLIRNI